jgi:hypothetical protein
MATTFASVVGDLQGNDNTPGFLHKGYVIPVADLTTIATPDLTANTDGLVVTADHVPDTGKGFTEVQTVYDVLTLESESPSEHSSTGLRYKIPMFIAGTGPANVAFTKQLQNGARMMLLLPDRDGVTHQFGNHLGEFVVLEPGTLKEEHSPFLGKKGFAFTLMADVKNKLFYQGDVTPKP